MANQASAGDAATDLDTRSLTASMSRFKYEQTKILNFFGEPAKDTITAM